MDENPGVTPILDTILSRSLSGMIWRINASTLATSLSVTEIREPEGALILMTNMPASVRGKKDKPRRGNRAKLAANEAPQSAIVSHGRLNAPPAKRS